MKLNELLQLKYPTVNFSTNIVLGYDESGNLIITQWNDMSEPEPDIATLAQWYKDYDLPYRIQQAIMHRVYPSVDSQLDMMYHDLVNGTTVWKDTITAIKLANPKPTV